MKLTILLLLFMLCACSPPAGNGTNAPAKLTAEQEAAYNADIKAILDDAHAAHLGVSKAFADEQRAVNASIERDLRPMLHRIWADNEHLATPDRRKLLDHKMGERRHEMTKAQK